MLEANEKQLHNKNKIIEQLKNEKTETPKKKLSVTTLNYAYNSPEHQSNNKVTDKIMEIEQRMKTMQAKIVEKHDYQAVIGRKVEYIEKGLIQYFSCKLFDCQSKLQKYFLSREQNLEKIYAEIQNMRNINTEIYANLGEDKKDMAMRMGKMEKYYNDLRQEIQVFAQKQFQYDNFQVEDLQNKIRNLIKNVGKLEAEKD